MSGDGKWARGVSIIGGAYTPFGNVLEREELKNMTILDLAAWASLEALQDAGISPKEVDSLIVNHVASDIVKQVTTSAHVAAWLGLTDKTAFRMESACSSLESCLIAGGSMIASGMCDVALIVSPEIFLSTTDEKIGEYRKDPSKRVPLGSRDIIEVILTAYDQGYTNNLAFDPRSRSGGWPMTAYAKKYNVSIEDIEEALNIAAINMRHCAALNPRAMRRTEYEDIAREAGFDDAKEYLKSPEHNPYVSWPLRQLHSFTQADGAAAVVLCATEIAQQYVKVPIEVAGVAVSSGWWFYPDPFSIRQEKTTGNRAYQMADLNPSEIEYLTVHDTTVAQHLWIPETAGYIEPGNGWRAIIEGRTALGGDRPINLHGGMSSFGNASTGTNGAEIVECLQQMRNECGSRQIDPPPHVSVHWSWGGGPSVGVSVLRRSE